LNIKEFEIVQLRQMVVGVWYPAAGVLAASEGKSDYQIVQGAWTEMKRRLAGYHSAGDIGT
jgi:hypothetical protein